MPKPGWHGAANGPEPPCYDRRTGTDCPDRCCGCQRNCEKWQAYVVERDKEYERRKNNCVVNSVILEQHSETHNKFVKKEQRLKRIYR